MNDKSNILGSLMGSKYNSSNKENIEGRGCNGTNSSKFMMQPPPPQTTTSASSSGKQHKLKQRFTVIRKLGKGTYGKVQLAINKETGQEVAIKTIKKTKIENEQDLQRVRREIQIMSSIEHPHIIHIYEVFENKDKIVLVMQYAPGGELYEYVSQSKLLDDSEARRLFRQIATAIYYCHQNKICHRDLKLENILLDEKNNAKLADFGLSNVFDKSYQLKTFCGSPLYASPEIVQGSPYEGPEVDCWSLGVLLYTLVYGAMPFDGSNFKRLVKQISESCYFEPKQKSQASPLIRKLLCADPNERATILDICSDPWVNGLSLSPGLVPGSGGGGGGHQSLLKVAQDMANLTPVRFDILLALTPDAMAAAAAASGNRNNNSVISAAAARPPLARIDNQKRRSSGGETGSERRSTQIALDPSSIMEVEEGRSTSPVASYIVRDLSNDNEPPSMIMDDENQVSIEPDATKENIVVSELENQQVALEKQRADFETNNVMDESTKPPQEPEEKEEGVQFEEEKELEIPEDKRDIIENDHSISEQEPSIEIHQEHVPELESKVDVETAIEVKTTEPPSDVQQVTMGENEEVVRMDVDSQVNLQEQAEVRQTEKVAASESVEPVEEKTQAKEEQVATGSEDTSKPVDADEKMKEGSEATEKPKKVKKKVVVVKKRKKRVSKKEGGEDENLTAPAAKEEDKSGKIDKEKDKDKDKESINNEAQDSDSSNTRRQSVSDNGKSGGKAKPQGPGKVRIPNTFQPQPPANQEPAPSNKTEGRRQSALVADVSQKLLQQSAATSSNTVNLIESDLSQLASVRVSDKKSEFERRASLAAISPTISKPVSPLHKPELYQAEVLHEPFEGGEQLTIVEPVTKQDPIEIQSAPCLIPCPVKQDESDSQTPTVQRQPVDLQATDVRRKLIDRLTNEQTEEHMSPGTGNDRSDSVETIKADASTSPIVLEMPNKRAQLSINLSDSSRVRKPENELETPSTSGQRIIATGPAPITRSYKKVTFTKDGACITETGRIYSAQADDGTVRRIERKSKITHYPVNKDSFGSGPEEGRHHEQVEEEEVYEEDGGRRAAMWQERQSSFMNQHHHNQTPRPLERLIMPTDVEGDGNDLFENRQDFHGGFSSTSGQQHNRPPSFSGRARSHSRQLGRADSSCSSCSSGSTDVFDDIFDHWTGAISMFNQSTFGGHHFRPFGGRASTRTSGGRRTPAAGGSLSGTPRCESAEPPPTSGSNDGHLHQSGGHLHNRRRRHREWRSPGANTSGYESDAASERPATALGGSFAGGTRGSLSRLFKPSLGSASITQRHDPFFATDTDPFGDSHFGQVDDLRRTIAQEHESLRRRLEQQHKQLWKGSTPSLFSATGQDEDPLMERSHKSHIRHHQQPPPPPAAAAGSIGQLLRNQYLHQDYEEESSSRANMDNNLNRRPPRPKSSSGSGSSLGNQMAQQLNKQPQNANQWPRENLEQSQSSSSFLRQSIALDSAPIRRNNQFSGKMQLPPRHEVQSTSMQRSTSKVSLLTSQIGDSEAVEQQQHQSTTKNQASFIELKRTSSSASAHREQRQVLISSSNSNSKQHQQESVASSSRIISNSGSSSAFWEKQATPTTPLSCGTTQSGLDDNRAMRDNLDSRVQSWLQESTGNMSTSSGSKSSVSGDQARPTPEVVSVQSSMLNRMRLLEEAATTMTKTTTAGGGEQPIVSTASSRVSSSVQQKEVKQSASSTVMASTSSSSANWINEQLVESLQSVADGTLQKQRTNRQVTTKATFTLRQAPPLTTSPEIEESKESFMARQQQQQVSSSQTSFITRRQTPTTAPIGGRMATDGPQWIHESSSRSIFGEEMEESLSGGCSAAELESRSSSSLLDQLRSRGYRSMINQRMVSQPPIDSQTSAATSTTTGTQVTSSSTSSQVKSSSSRVVTSSSSTRVVQQQAHSRQVITSSSSSTTGGVSIRKTQVIEDDEDEVASTAKLESIYDQVNNDFKVEPLKENGFCEDNTTKDKETDRAKLSNGNSGLISSMDAGELKESISNGVETDQSKLEQLDEDEDVREAKASIKLHLDRVKETEMFLKTLHAEEAETERQRQQLFMFNNLMLSTKLNGISKNRSLNPDEGQLLQIESPTINTVTYTGPRSAPVYMASNFGITTPPFESSSISTNGYMNSTQPSVKRTILPEESEGCFSSLAMSYATRKLHEQPLTNLVYEQSNNHYNSSNGIDYSPPLVKYNPMNFYSSNSNHFSGSNSSRDPEFRRSRSQLGDQFTSIGVSNPRRGARPLSANLDSSNWMSNDPTQSAYFPSRSRRSFSQVRQPATNNSRLSYNGGFQATGLSEYSQNNGSGYASPRATRPHWSGSTGEAVGSSLTELNNRSISINNREHINNHDIDDEDDDHELSAYRASAYVPKVVPQGMPARGRSYQRQNKKFTTSDWTLNRAETGNSRRLANLDTTRTSLKGYEEVKRERRISLQEASTDSSKCNGGILRNVTNSTTSPRDSSPSYRRTSLTSNLPENSTSGGQGNQSRLSELEQRIKENKRRREELLAGRAVSPEPNSQSETTTKSSTTAAEEKASNSQKSTTTTTSSNVKLNSRPSRLESMEARIKRRSYCVRTSPERRSQQNLEKWRRSSNVGRRDSNGSTDSTSTGGSLLSNSKGTD